MRDSTARRTLTAIPLVMSLLCMILTSACSTFQPTAASPEQIQRLIISERLVAPGDRVRLVTADNSVYDFRIAAIDIDEGLVIGTTAVIPIQDIVEIETRQLSWIKTGLLLGVSALALATADTDELARCGQYGVPYYYCY